MLAYVSRVDLPIGMRCKTRQENYFIEVCVEVERYSKSVGKGDATIRELQILYRNLKKCNIFVKKVKSKIDG